MVRAILDGRKTQTRRIFKRKHGPLTSLPESAHMLADGGWGFISPPEPDEKRARRIIGGGPGYQCPYGQPGDRLWVRETWRPVMESWRSFVEYAAEGPTLDNVNRDLLAPLTRVALRFPGARKERNSEAWHPSIHMPRWASRISLEVKAVRVERLQDISEADAQAEGVEAAGGFMATGGCWQNYLPNGPSMATACESFQSLWEHISGPESWQANPWVWVVEFARVHP
jgi:hypothetical protein